MRHKYPKTRKNRDTSYAKCNKLLEIVGAEKFKEIFSRKGMYLAADELSIELGYEVSPYLCHYIKKYKLEENIV